MKIGNKDYPERLVRLTVKRLIEQYCHEISTHTVQLWIVIEDNADKAKPLGSAVLLTINDKYYLLTAAHVIDGCDISNIAFWDNQDLVRVSGNVAYLSNASEINKNGDVAVWQLSEDATFALLKHYHFLPFDRVKLRHNIVAQERYIILGYPVSKTKKIYHNMTIPIKTCQFVTSGDVTSRKYFHNNLNPQVNFMLVYHRRKVQGFGTDKKQIEHLPDPHGMSGCGLWYLDEDKHSRLVGLMIGYNHTDSIMIASRIDLVTEIIRKKFDMAIPSNHLLKRK